MQRQQTLAQHVTLVVALAVFTVGAAVISYSSLQASGHATWALGMLAGMAVAAVMALLLMRLFPGPSDPKPARRPSVLLVAGCGIFGVAANRLASREMIAAALPAMLTLVLTIGSAAVLERVRARRRPTIRTGNPAATDATP